MSSNIVSLIIVLLMIISSFGAIGSTNTLYEDYCGCDLSNKLGYSLGDGWEERCGLNESLNPDWKENAPLDSCIYTNGVFPSRFDWREEIDSGSLPDVRDQSFCGSCWAFGTIGPLECNIKIQDGIDVDLSEQYLVSCNEEGYSCGGGWFVHEYHMDKEGSGNKAPGPRTEDQFRYRANNVACSDCKDQCSPVEKYKISRWSYIGSSSGLPDTNAIKNAIMTYGPISAAVAADEDFSNYRGGIYKGSDLNKVNHAIVLVGWDDSKGSNGCWILRNSWGDDWGYKADYDGPDSDGGYMYIEYGANKIGYAACYVVYEGEGLGDNRVNIKVKKVTNEDEYDLLDLDFGAEWYYEIELEDIHQINCNTNDGKYTTTLGDWNSGEWEPNKVHIFKTSENIVDFSIKLFEYDETIDIFGFKFNDDDLADISGCEGGGTDSHEGTDYSGAVLNGRYDLIYNTIELDFEGYDTTKIDGTNYIIATGNKDGSTGILEDEDDAALFFNITDNFEPDPDLECDGSISWSNVNPGATVHSSFTVKNNDSHPNSKLDWEIQSEPSWGDWTFDYQDGKDTDLTPSDGEVTVDVTCIAPSVSEDSWDGEIIIVNSEDSSDSETITISLATPKSRNTHFIYKPLELFRLFFRFFPNLMIESLFLSPNNS